MPAPSEEVDERLPVGNVLTKSSSRKRVLHRQCDAAIDQDVDPRDRPVHVRELARERVGGGLPPDFTRELAGSMHSSTRSGISR